MPFCAQYIGIGEYPPVKDIRGSVYYKSTLKQHYWYLFYLACLLIAAEDSLLHNLM